MTTELPKPEGCISRAVTLIAPVYPFRGGIARHSESIGRALMTRGDVTLRVESFARLFPLWLYPGASDRDPSAVEHAPQLPVRFSIDTLNPLTWRKVAAAVANRGGISVIPVWTFFVAPALGSIARMLRANGVKVVMIVHNVGDHEASRWKSFLINWQLAAADGLLTHTNSLADQLRKAGHNQPTSVVTHPAYSGFPRARGLLPRTHALELLIFGLVRHYKGVEIALRALAASGLDDVRLTIAGEIWDNKETLRNLAQSAKLNGKVELYDRYVSDQEAAELFNRCDAVLAPYRSVTGSGVLAMAQHYQRPVIASDLAGLTEFVNHGQNGWLFPAADETALAQLLRDTVTRETTDAMQRNLSLAYRGDWHNYAAAILDLVDICSSSGTCRPRIP